MHVSTQNNFDAKEGVSKVRLTGHIWHAWPFYVAPPCMQAGGWAGVRACMHVFLQPLKILQICGPLCEKFGYSDVKQGWGAYLILLDLFTQSLSPITGMQYGLCDGAETVHDHPRVQNM